MLRVRSLVLALLAVFPAVALADSSSSNGRGLRLDVDTDNGIGIGLRAKLIAGAGPQQPVRFEADAFPFDGWTTVREATTDAEGQAHTYDRPKITTRYRLVDVRTGDSTELTIPVQLRQISRIRCAKHAPFTTARYGCTLTADVRGLVAGRRVSASIARNGSGRISSTQIKMLRRVSGDLFRARFKVRISRFDFVSLCLTKAQNDGYPNLNTDDGEPDTERDCAFGPS